MPLCYPNTNLETTFTQIRGTDKRDFSTTKKSTLWGESEQVDIKHRRFE